MSSAPLPATPDVMALLCVIGRAMRGVGASHVGMQLLLIAVLHPPFGDVMRTWLAVEAHVGRAPESDDPWWADDPDEGDGAVRSGWISRTGPVWRWRQVARTGIVGVMLVRWFAEQTLPEGPRRKPVWSPSETVGRKLRRFVFPEGPGSGRSRALFVPYF